jgi:TonB family protein
MNLLTPSPCRAALLSAVLAAAAGLAPFHEARSAVERPESEQEYWAQVDERDWDAALVAAEKLVIAARANARQQPFELAEALSLLGNAQLGKKDYTAARASFSEALKLVEEHAGSTSPKLLDPLRGMGYTFAASGLHRQAVEYLDTALLISHRSYGLFDLGQQGILRQLASSLTRIGRVPEAERHMQYLLRVGERVYGRSDLRLIPSLILVGDWYGDVGEFPTAREHYRSALSIVERKQGRNDLGVVEPLRALAQSYTKEILYSSLGLPTGRDRVPTDADGTSNEFKSINPRYIDSEGEKALERALKILESNPNAARRTTAETLVQLGDWFQLKHLPEKALPYYRRAAAMNLESGTAEGGDSGPGLLSFPVRVYYPAPSGIIRNTQLPADQVDEKYVQVEFTVTDEGYVTNAKIIEQNGTARQASDVLQAIRQSRFRPKFVNGEPVETQGVTSREVFKVRKAESQS